jgi:hypothetical protein
LPSFQCLSPRKRKALCAALSTAQLRVGAQPVRSVLLLVAQSVV